jgi:hypothetical protein
MLNCNHSGTLLAKHFVGLGPMKMPYIFDCKEEDLRISMTKDKEVWPKNKRTILL